MWLMLTYIGLALIGNAVIYFVGLAIERMWPIASLPAFLLMFFVVLWLAWLGAVKFTEPKTAPELVVASIAIRSADAMSYLRRGRSLSPSRLAIAIDAACA